MAGECEAAMVASLVEKTRGVAEVEGIGESESLIESLEEEEWEEAMIEGVEVLEGIVEAQVVCVELLGRKEVRSVEGAVIAVE